MTISITNPIDETIKVQATVLTKVNFERRLPVLIDLNIIKNNDIKFLFLEKTPNSLKNRFGFSWFFLAFS